MAESNAFPWLKHLPEDAQREFFEELSEAFGDAQLRTMPGVLVSPATYVEVLDPVLASWKATAEVHADPELYKALTQDGGFDEEDFALAPRPGDPSPVRCSSNVPHESDSDSARWCSFSEGHGGPHTDRDGLIWNDQEARERAHGRMPLPCGWCFRENGEEVHPHPECPERVNSSPACPEEYRESLEGLYGGDWSTGIAVEPCGPDSVNTELPEQRNGGHDCG